MKISVVVKMSFLLLLHLLLHLCVSAKQSGLEETVKDDLEKTMYKSEKLNKVNEEELMQRMGISWKKEKAHLENKLETKNVEVEDVQKQLKEMKVQFTAIESRMEEMMLNTQKKNQNQEMASLKKQVTEMESKLENVASIKSELRAELEKELDKVEQGLRDLPFEMVCAYKYEWFNAVGVISYDRITVEFNNSNRPGGADGTMNIETGVFTTVTSGYYIITFSAHVKVFPGQDHTQLWLYHNGVQVEESQFATWMHVGSGDDFIIDQGSRTVVNIVFNS